MKKTQKYITFDLKVKELEKKFGEGHSRTGYAKLKKFFEGENDFEHTQYSAYCSKNKMSDVEVFLLLEQLKKECPWLQSCLRKIEVTDVGDIRDVTHMFTDETELTQTQSVVKNKAGTLSKEEMKNFVNEVRKDREQNNKEKSIPNKSKEHNDFKTL